MEFIQKKTADHAVEGLLVKAAESETSLVWDRYEGQLPECGFCETGLSCRDCLQGPCISHPFQDANKLGVCGKDKDILAIQSLLRLVLKGTMAYLDQVSDFTKGVESGEIKPKNKVKTDKILKEIQNLFENGGVEVKKELPKPFTSLWDQIGISPEGIARDLFKASQRLEGGVSDVEETLLWAFKSSLLGCMAHWFQGNLIKSVFGDLVPAMLEVNLGVLKKETPNLLLCGLISPILKGRIAEEAKKKGVHVTGVCTDPLVSSFSFSPVTNYGSQEIPLMTGAVDLMVVGDQFVNPSLTKIAREWEVPVVPTELLKKEKNLGRFAKEIVERTKNSFDFRRNIPRDIPDVRENAMMGFSPENVNVKKMLGALDKGQLTGIAILSGSNNVKYTQDQDPNHGTDFLRNDVLCISRAKQCRLAKSVPQSYLERKIVVKLFLIFFHLWKTNPIHPRFRRWKCD
jgi:carbon-monoxide dehydrogenase catalytic subunit